MKTNKDILQIENTLLKLENLHASFDYLRISIASQKESKVGQNVNYLMVNSLEKFLSLKQLILEHIILN